MAELADALDSESSALWHAGSTPVRYIYMQMWRNWQTRQTQDLVPKGVWVRLPSSALLDKVNFVPAEV